MNASINILIAKVENLYRDKKITIEEYLSFLNCLSNISFRRDNAINLCESVLDKDAVIEKIYEELV